MVPVPGTRKNCTSKYSRSSVDKTFGRCPSTVRIQRERNRVSHAKSPRASVGEASISPRKSLTTKLLPSRTLIVVFSPIVFSFIPVSHWTGLHRERAAETSEPERHFL